MEMKGKFYPRHTRLHIHIGTQHSHNIMLLIIIIIMTERGHKINRCGGGGGVGT